LPPRRLPSRRLPSRRLPPSLARTPPPPVWRPCQFAV